jgi:uncharacterized protein (TIGR03000 family)
MKRVLFIGGFLALLATRAAVALELVEQQAATAGARTARVTVTVPDAEASLVLDGKIVPGDGTSRTIEIPALQADGTRRYTFTAIWQPNTYTEITRRKVVTFKAGEPLRVDLTVDDPNDRARVRYVPTPPEIADEMVKLAGITAQDIVFEPGCGDARITIAAVRGGAGRGVGIDIDPERVDDSRDQVKKAGLDKKIEIRLGDALDIKDLSSASVVFLYMGDHFNLLIRPILWRELKVGSRVVSHRFTMGDWKPERTVNVTSDGGIDYELHLWTITEDIKRRASQ